MGILDFFLKRSGRFGSSEKIPFSLVVNELIKKMKKEADELKDFTIIPRKYIICLNPKDNREYQELFAEQLKEDLYNIAKDIDETIKEINDLIIEIEVDEKMGIGKLNVKHEWNVNIKEILKNGSLKSNRRFDNERHRKIIVEVDYGYTKKELEFNKSSILIGREEAKVDIHLPDPENKISGEHAEIETSENDYYLTAKGLNDNIFLDGKLIPSGEKVNLGRKQIIRIEKYQLRII